MLAAPREDRFESLDVLRGVAVLGIFAVNIQAMALPAAMFANPTLNTEFFNEEGRSIWAFVSTFFQFKFITIFSVLFGAGIVLMVGEEKPTPRTALHRRRMMWLLLFGLLHAFLIWFGDILAAYAIAGLIAAGTRRWRPRTLFIAGVLLIALASLVQFSMYLTPEEARAEMVKGMWAPPPEALAEETAHYREGFFARLPHMAMNAVIFELVQTVMLGPRTIGLMMFGMAFFKLGFFTLRWSFLQYAVSGVVALAAGVAASSYATAQFFAHEFDMFALAPAQTAQYWGSLPHAFGYCALVMALCKLPGLAFARAPFAAAGRMALTNYLGCSIFGALLYYGPPGLGRIGTASYPELAMTVVFTWIAILAASPLWLTMFRYGPFEWLWRSLTYWRLQPLLK